ncbi:MAG: sulfatase-like hydrolase/transferase [Lachnospiraceae bacterium]|nr:sulfatase-like hydrolase/transferase [Lachnospiraceae bacterium]
MKERLRNTKNFIKEKIKFVLRPVWKAVTVIMKFLYNKPLLLNALIAVIFAVVLEEAGRQSFPLSTWGFITQKTSMFLYSVFILFFSYSIVLIVRKRIFAYIVISVLWGGVGLVNFLMLDSRNTPFTYVDITLMKSVLPVITNYYSMPAIIAMGSGLLIGLVLLVSGFLYLPQEEKFTKPRTLKNVIAFAVIAIAFLGTTKYNLSTGFISTEIHNIRLAYSDYGTPYCFTVTALKTGIDRPSNYSEEKIEKIVEKTEKASKTTAKKSKVKKQTPNIIFVQLESFFDPTQVKGLKFNKDPIPNFHRLMRNYSSGHTMTPSYGAGTANTEFEIMTQMDLDLFGAAEYPYKTVLQDHTCESVMTDLKQEGYSAHAIHNNSAAFYDRDLVFANLGYDTFTTKECMDIQKWTENGWSKDYILTDQIKDVLDSTENQDFIYTISVQGHGDYPTNEVIENPVIDVEGIEDEALRNKYIYYSNQIYQMDQFVGELVKSLEERGEDTILVMYGDHLPSLDVEDEDLTYGNKYWTSYFIWDNIGLKKQDGNIETYQLAANIMDRIGLHNGILTKFHQTQSDSKTFQNDLRNLQYDIFYGKNYMYNQENPYEATDIEFGVKNLSVKKIYESDNGIFMVGNNFTSYTNVVVEGNKISTTFHNKHLIEISKEDIKDGDTFEVDIISKAPRTLSRSPEYVFRQSGASENQE